ncbi:MAG: integrase family protein [Methylotenera sp.]|nr:integrase family protein [Methylotenera sp.]PPD18978.1 MAG: integrase [Methylotenera sp.]
MLQKLTKAFVDKVGLESSGQMIYRDSDLMGFCLRVGTKTKIYFVESKLRTKTLRVTIGRHDVFSLDDARTQAKVYLADIARGHNPLDAEKARKSLQVTLSSVLDDYIETRVNLKASTIEDYRRTFKQYLGDWQNKPLIDVTKDMVEAKFRKIGEDSPAMANKTMRNFRAVVNYAMFKYENTNGDSIFRVNPVNRLTQLRAWYRVNRRNTLIKNHELAAWYSAVMNLKNDTIAPNRETIRDFLLFLLFTGLRRSEAANLKWSNVDFKDKSFLIKDTKNHDDHQLPMTTFLFDMLVRRKTQATTQYVFANETGKGGLTDPKKQIRNVVNESGVSFSSHDLRRTFITIAESLDIPAYALKKLLNHRMQNDVTAGYIIMDVGRLRAPMQKITDYILSCVCEKEKAVVILLNQARG